MESISPGSKAAKKTKPKDRSKMARKKKTLISLPPTEPAPTFSHKHIREILFKYSQISLFHPGIYNFLASAYPPLVKGVNVENSTSIFWTSELVQVIRKEIPKILKMRFSFKILLHHWRLRRLSQINTEDIATTEVPKKAVYIVDWISKSKHVFEASTLMRDITERLMQHDGVFDTCAHPRNPFTNTPLTQSQMISVWNQISYSGIPTSTAFSAFRQSRWNMRRFEDLYSHMLKINALRKTMSDTSHPDYMERMADFIQYVYDYESEPCNIEVYKYALLHSKRHRLLKVWAKLCTNFYEASILFSDSDKFIAIRDNIFRCASLLFNRIKELRNVF